ncbi:response regulator transcription factor [Aneurinibacillus migulanus]|uniref:DNA-binding response regulator, OmpR family, contains REC and winged-helix (WHTH) domain n=1 Tax=Aneurinibacillus migulanus TaxID=47500 RepID=A0A0D1WBB0_ANEMI|nr:response regulator transcription factor [Aneurinibacillus migulanus]KIV55845.1 transcriptional regulator [Aneurinibacillus migulanus]KON97757.1 transcriptional regulator [Aneurinibacillus migulanus]MED0894320.1 response regulator transcription factor [Aneurinibacillus migulanus]MED1618988.1 response regulator transcription factor [Aneurinibacillus migulanus]SDK47930.1 DNA-binding response regulator, OmpR family, contains REC and winged-helix (wHTH) domain [Aneurinibacillus migulanus]
MRKILLVEDDLSLIEGLKFFLSKQGFDVTISRTVKEAKAYFRQYEFHLILLDLMLPDGSGFDLCKIVRQTSNVPIIFLTASDEETNVVMGLDIGGDDYMTKPLKLNELISRMNATWRRLGFANEQVAELSANGITVKLLEGRVLKNGTELELTATEYKLLCLFMQNPNLVLSKEQIMQKLWDGHENFIDDNTLAVYISRLRDKIEDHSKQPSFLTTIRGMGYKWNVR